MTLRAMICSTSVGCECQQSGSQVSAGYQLQLVHQLLPDNPLASQLIQQVARMIMLCILWTLHFMLRMHSSGGYHSSGSASGQLAQFALPRTTCRWWQC